jgi:hypothetical protein
VLTQFVTILANDFPSAGCGYFAPNFKGCLRGGNDGFVLISSGGGYSGNLFSISRRVAFENV